MEYNITESLSNEFCLLELRDRCQQGDSNTISTFPISIVKTYCYTLICRHSKSEVFNEDLTYRWWTKSEFNRILCFQTLSFHSYLFNLIQLIHFLIPCSERLRTVIDIDQHNGIIYWTINFIAKKNISTKLFRIVNLMMNK